MKRLAVTNQKGGLGKTTTSVFLSRCLADDYKKKVLFIDLDIQGNSSFTLNAFDSDIKASDLLTHELSDLEIKKIISKADENENNISLLHASAELANDVGFEPEHVYKCAEHNLKALEEHFDFVVLDTPPTLGNKLVISLLITEEVIIPLELDTFALQGLNKLLSTIFSLKNKGKKINILGLVINKFVPNRKRQLDILSNLNKSEKLSEKIFNTKIRFRDCISDALSNRLALTKLRKFKGHDSSSYRTAVNDFRNLTLEVLTRLKK